MDFSIGTAFLVKLFTLINFNFEEYALRSLINDLLLK
jgi:hypothetical protein